MNFTLVFTHLCFLTVNPLLLYWLTGAPFTVKPPPSPEIRESSCERWVQNIPFLLLSSSFCIKVWHKKKLRFLIGRWQSKVEQWHDYRKWCTAKTKNLKSIQCKKVRSIRVDGLVALSSTLCNMHVHLTSHNVP